METKILSFRQMTEAAGHLNKMREIFGEGEDFYPVYSAVRNHLEDIFYKVLFKIESGETNLGNTDDFLLLLEEFPEIFYKNCGYVLEKTLKQLKIYRDARPGYRNRIHQLLMNRKVIVAVKDESLKEAEGLWQELVS